MYNKVNEYIYSNTLLYIFALYYLLYAMGIN